MVTESDVIVILREVTLNNDVDKYGSEVCGIIRMSKRRVRAIKFSVQGRYGDLNHQTYV